MWCEYGTGMVLNTSRTRVLTSAVRIALLDSRKICWLKWGLTPELSRPVAGRRTCASVAQSTRPTPRHGVGLNELLGGGGCRCEPSPNVLAESRSGKVRTRTRELSAGCNRSDRVSCGNLTETNHFLRSRSTQRMRSVSAPSGLDRRSKVA